MGLRLSVQRTAWLHSLETAAAQRPGLIPVVKGNGYGFGRGELMPIATRLATRGQIAVGTVFEAHDVPADIVGVVLTPHIDVVPAAVPPSTILTVGNIDHVLALQRNGWTGAVSIKLASSMRRYGVDADALPGTVAAAESAGFAIEGFAIHLPLAGTDESRHAEVEAWLPLLDAALPLSVSHLAPPTYAALRAAHPHRSLQIRCGTALWHADRQRLHLTADVLDVHPVGQGSTAGYHATAIPSDGHLVLVAAGSAHGVRPLDNGLSPFHFARQRVPLLEGPHMHTSILFVADGLPLPSIGERVDVQRPLIETKIDELEWVDD